MRWLSRLISRKHRNEVRWASPILFIVALAIQAGAPAYAQQPVVPMTRTLRALQVAPPTFQAPFRVEAHDRQVFKFTLDVPGSLRVRATWSGASSLALILNGPGQTGYYARQDGGSPLAIDFAVTADLLERGSQWQISVVNFQQSDPRGEGTLTMTLPRPSAAPAPAAEPPTTVLIPQDQPLRPPRLSPSTVQLLQRPTVLDNGAVRFALGNGLMAQLSPTDTLTIYDPDRPDSTQTTVLYSTHVQVDDPPVPPAGLATDSDFSFWWMQMQAWMGGLNARMLASIGQAFNENAMQTVEQLEADEERASPFDQADFRLRYLEKSIPVLKEQIETLLSELETASGEQE